MTLARAAIVGFTVAIILFFIATMAAFFSGADLSLLGARATTTSDGGRRTTEVAFSPLAPLALGLICTGALWIVTHVKPGSKNPTA